MRYSLQHMEIESYPYKISDPIHSFVCFNSLEKQVIDSAAFQRLRYIRQMGVAYLVYPSATHCRFAHCLGVMELATKIYNRLLDPAHLVIPLPISSSEVGYWRQILRLAALCHDMGHLPFSHTAEKEMLPQGGHEKMTQVIIQSEELRVIWQQLGPDVEKDILALAVSHPGFERTDWQTCLAQVITEDNFGADRIDYLIRDTLYAGTGHGNFDYHQLIDTLRILPKGGLSLGIASSGMQSVEALWMARYMMYARVYRHPKVWVFSYHLRRFMTQAYLKGFADYLAHTDYTVLTDIFRSSDYHALCLQKRAKPYQKISCNKSVDLPQEFEGFYFVDEEPEEKPKRNFPVLLKSKEICSSITLSDFLREIPLGREEINLYVHPQKEAVVLRFLDTHESLV